MKILLIILLLIVLLGCQVKETERLMDQHYSYTEQPNDE